MHTEAPISITIKTAAGSLVTVRASTSDELDQLVAEGYGSIVSAVQELEAGIRQSAPAPMSAAQVAQSLGGQVVDADSFGGGPVTAPATSIPSLGGRNCAHGKMTAIQGTGKDGSTYRGYFCAAPKGAFDKCKNQYVKAGSPEWNTFVPDQVK